MGVVAFSIFMHTLNIRMPFIHTTVAQLVERHSPKVLDGGSNPSCRAEFSLIIYNKIFLNTGM
jgi:hypothetical protein